MKVLVVGGGSIGKRHIGNFSQLPGVQVTACEINPDRAKQIQQQFPAIQVFTNLEAAFNDGPQALVICTPPHLHTSIGKQGAERGMHLFIEKPIADKLDGLAELLTYCDEKKLAVMTAYLFRFSPSLHQIREIVHSGKLGRVLGVRTEYASYLPDWHPWEDYRAFYMAKKAQGGGAILDESHAVDFTQWVIGDVQSVMAYNGRVSGLEIETDDLAEVLVQFKNGAVGSIHMDLYSRPARSGMSINLEKGSIVWDRYTNEIKVWYADRQLWEVTTNNRPLAELYVEEAKHFLDCIAKGTRPVIDGWEGMKALEIVDAAIRSSEQGKRIEVKHAIPKELAGVR